jgi:hypothetical protein
VTIEKFAGMEIEQATIRSFLMRLRTPSLYLNPLLEVYKVRPPYLVKSTGVATSLLGCVKAFKQPVTYYGRCITLTFMQRFLLQ